MKSLKRVTYECPFVPAEWIGAHGLQPSRIMPRARRGGGIEGLCAYARAFGDRLAKSDAAAVIVTTVCDPLRRLPELPGVEEGPPLFLFNVPATWQSRGAQELYLEELRRLGRFLVELGGVSPSDEELACVMLEFDERRGWLRDARGKLSPRAFAEAIACFHRGDPFELEGLEGSTTHSGVPLALVGGPLLLEHLELFDLVEAHGGHIALDATDTGERGLPAPFDRRALREAPLLHLADAYFGTIPSAFRRPNSELYRWLRERMSERGIAGILFKRYVWCDLWNAESERMREWTDVPLLAIDTHDQGLDPSLASRVQALLEVLR